MKCSDTHLYRCHISSKTDERTKLMIPLNNMDAPHSMYVVVSLYLGLLKITDEYIRCTTYCCYGTKEECTMQYNKFLYNGTVHSAD